MSTVTIYRRRIPEMKIDGMPLGRNVHYDSRSALYPFRSSFPRSEISARAWARSIPPLDQGNLGSCTGNAIVGCAATSPVFEGLAADHPALDESLAVQVYSLATSLDPYPGAYPPDDTGSDGIDACKAGVQLGLMSGYTHCTDLATMELALQTGPVAIGINWYSSFDMPDANGLVKIAGNAYVRGGHEVEVLGIDPAAQMLYAVNSWGSGWGKHGTFCFSYATMERLLAEEGDCTVPVPVNAPAPVPVPTPPDPDPTPVPPDPADNSVPEWWRIVMDWTLMKHYAKNTKKVAAANQDLARKHGLYGA
jgi:hypothetical protein